MFELCHRWHQAPGTQKIIQNQPRVGWHWCLWLDLHSEKKLQIKFALYSCSSQCGQGVGRASITWDPVQKWGPHPGPNESKSVFLQNSEWFLCMLPLAGCWLVHKNWAYEFCLPTYTFGWNAWVPNQHCALPTCLGYRPPSPSMLLNWGDKSQAGALAAAVDILASIKRTPFPGDLQ